MFVFLILCCCKPEILYGDFTSLQEFATDIAACLDSWVGGIKTVHSKLLIQCADGSRCVINDVEATGLEDFNEKRDCVSKCIVKHVFLCI